MERQSFKLLIIAGFAILLCLGQIQQAEAANIVVNGGFDADGGPVPFGWKLAGAVSGSDFMITGGAFGANFGASAGSDDQLSQTFATTAGNIYTFDFFLAHSNTDAANDFHALWNGASVLDLVNAAYFHYTEYTFREVATGPTTTIEFDGRENPAWYELDNVSVIETTGNGGATDPPVPEPGTLLLLGTGLIGVGILRRRKQ